jgi:hypothetical protein
LAEWLRRVPAKYMGFPARMIKKEKEKNVKLIFVIDLNYKLFIVVSK